MSRIMVYAHSTGFDITQPPILVSRFIMNLRQLDSTEESTSPSMAHGSGHFSTLNFRPQNTIVGNMGEPLDHRKITRPDAELCNLHQQCHDDFEGDSGSVIQLTSTVGAAP